MASLSPIKYDRAKFTERLINLVHNRQYMTMLFKSCKTCNNMLDEHCISYDLVMIKELELFKSAGNE